MISVFRCGFIDMVKQIFQKFYLACLIIFTISFSHAETFKMAYNQDWEPYSYGTGSEVNGILVDKVNEYFANMGIEVSHFGIPWNRVQKSVEQGLLDGFISVPTKTRLAYSNSSEQIVFVIEMKPVVSTDALSKTPINKAEDLRLLRICDIFGNGWAKNFYNNLNVKAHEAPTVDNCLKMIDKGRMDVIVQPFDVTSSKIKLLGLEDSLTILPPVFGRMEFTLLVSKKSGFQKNFIEQFDKLISETNK